MKLYVVFLKKKEDTTKDNKVNYENQNFNSIISSNLPFVFPSFSLLSLMVLSPFFLCDVFFSPFFFVIVLSPLFLCDVFCSPFFLWNVFFSSFLPLFFSVMV